MRRIIISISMMVFLLASSAQCAVYYVSGTSGSDSNPGTITAPWKTIYKANIALQPGDTVYIRGGVYEAGDSMNAKDYQQAIRPSQSGANGNVITYSAYPGETVTVKGTHNRSFAVNLQNRSYIRVTGINFQNMYLFMWIMNGNYNEIDKCVFGPIRYRTDGVGPNWRGSTIYKSSTHNYIHENTFYDYGQFVSGSQEGVVFEIGDGSTIPCTDASHYNTIANNHIYHGGHHVFGINSKYNVIRGNNIHNEGWYGSSECSALYDDGKCGYRVVSMSGYTETTGENLIESNRISYGGPELDNVMIGGSGLSLGTAKNIVRFNDFYGNNIYGLRLGTSLSAAGSDVRYNKIYNNTFYHNGYGPNADVPLAKYPHLRSSLYINASSGNISIISNNTIKNNLFSAVYPGESSIYPANWAAYQVVSNNCEECVGDPAFVNTDMSNKLSNTLPDLSLQSSSPIKNTGSHLTVTNGSGSSSQTLVVDDARYFQDGKWGSNLSRAAKVIQADWIAIGTVYNAVQISAIDYSTNTITLASPMTWKGGDSVWLYKKSDGTKVLSGTAPAMGAHEVIEPPAPPQNLMFK